MRKKSIISGVEIPCGVDAVQAGPLGKDKAEFS